MTGLELAIEFTDLWGELDADEINSMLANNVSFDLLEFFSSYAEQFGRELGAGAELDVKELNRKLPNLLIIGYIIRVLEERLT